MRRRLKERPELQSYYAAVRSALVVHCLSFSTRLTKCHCAEQELQAFTSEVIQAATTTRPSTKFATALQRASGKRAPSKLKYKYPSHVGHDPLAWLDDVEEQLNTNAALRRVTMAPLTQLADLRISKDDAIKEVEEEEEDETDDDD